jgi:hypothetical protein
MNTLSASFLKVSDFVAVSWEKAGVRIVIKREKRKVLFIEGKFMWVFQSGNEISQRDIAAQLKY